MRARTNAAAAARAEGTNPTAKLKAQTRRERVEGMERAILAAARAVFVQNGFERAKIAEIARRAGVAEGTIYIYYKTKIDVLQAVVHQFWAGITEGAATVVDPRAATFEQLRALADHHLALMIADRDLIELEYILRNSKTEPFASEFDTIRRYVAVFDSIFRRGQDRGDLSLDADLWIARDLFFGTLEYSARTAVLRGLQTASGVAENLVEVFRSRYGWGKSDLAPPRSLLDRLEAAINRLEAQAGSAGDA